MKTIIYLLVILISSSNLIAQVDFREESIYFLMTTRFYDGDPSNNVATEWSSYFPGNPHNDNYSGPEDVTWRGDFAGLIEKLDYIKDLGFTAIWITPIVQNRSPLDYHGYHAWDFETVDPRYESEGATFQDLVNAVHAKGMKIVLDIVTNHAGRFGIKNKAEIKYNTDPTKPWGQNAAGEILKDNPNWEYDGLTPNPDDGLIWSRANIQKLDSPFDNDLSQYNFPGQVSYVETVDPNWYHQSGNGFAQGYDDTTNLYLRALAGDTPDLNTSSKVVQDYMFNAYKKYIDMGVDAFRWDTFKHMSKEDILALLDRFKAYKPDLFVFGEVAQKRHELHSIEEINPHWYTWRGEVNNSEGSGASVIDFFGHATFHNIFEDGGSFSGVQAAARYDHLYHNPSELITWLDNHDFGPNNDWNRRYGGSDENLAACMNFMFTWRGIPAVYYGTESRFKAGVFNDIHDASGINKSINETGRAYYGDEMDNAPNHIIYQHIKKLNAMRKAIPALQKGSWEWKNAPGNGVAYKRVFEDSEVIVGLAKDGDASFSISGLSNGVYRDAVTGREIVVSSGNINFAVGSGSAGIYVLNGPGMIGESGKGFFEPCVNNCEGYPVVEISPSSGNYESPIMVNISTMSGNGNKTIHFTTDGTEPSTSSSIYTTPIEVSRETIIRAIAIDQNGRISDINGQQYTFDTPKPKVIAIPTAGNYFDPISVELSPSTGQAPFRVFYTLDGTEPTTNSNLYTIPISISEETTIKYFVIDDLNVSSDIKTASYTFNIPNPILNISPTPKNYPNPPITIEIESISPRNPVTIYYTIDGTKPTINSNIYYQPLLLEGNKNPITIQYFGIDAEGRTSPIYESEYSFFEQTSTFVYFKKPETWNNLNIHYWDAIPEENITETSWPGDEMIAICEGSDWYSFEFIDIESINLIFSDNGSNQTDNLSITETSYYNNGWLTEKPNLCPDVVPTISVNPISQTTTASSLDVEITGENTTSIYYTLDGSNPSTSNGNLYTGKFDITNNLATVTLKAIGIGTTSNTTIVERNYTFEGLTPTISVNPISQTTTASSLDVEITGENTTSIYYTLDGSNPSTSNGNLYTGKFDITNNLATVTLKAIGIGTTSNTNIVERNYTFEGLTPTISINPISQTTTASSLDVEITGENTTSIYYTLDGNNPSASNGNLYTGKFDITNNLATVTLKAIGIGTTSNTNIVERNYIFEEPASTKVYFKKPSHWSNASIYYWNPTPSSDGINTSWPGERMTKECSTSDWYYIEFNGVENINVIFSDNGQNQTADLVANGTAYYDNKWLTNTPDLCPALIPTITINPSSQTTTASSLDVEITGENTTSIYYTLDGNNPSASNGNLYTGKFDITNNLTTVTLKAIGIGTTSNTSIKEETYVFEEEIADDLTIKWKPEGQCDNPSIYYWNTNGSTNNPITWNEQPSMESKENGWFEYVLNGVQSSNIILTCNKSIQSADIMDVTENTCYIGLPSNLSTINCNHTNSSNINQFSLDAKKSINEDYYFNVYPNPVKDEAIISLDLPNTTQVNMNLYNINGQLVGSVYRNKELVKGNHRILLNVRDYLAGIYFLNVRTQSGYFQIKKLAIK